MDYVRRVTLRCLCEDLTEDWGDAAQYRKYQALWDAVCTGDKDSEVAVLLESLPSVGLADHPLVRSFKSSFAFSGAEVRRESISGLTEPHWWKQKVSRWRGAATDADMVGDREAWLCAGGLRAAGDDRDFYRSFMRRISTDGARHFLPDEHDRRLQNIEAKIARREAWCSQIQLSALVCLERAYREAKAVPLHVPAPFPSHVEVPLAHLEFEVASEAIQGEELIELTLNVSSQDTSKPYLLEDAVSSIREMVEPVVEEWRLLPGRGNDLIWSTYVPRDVIGAAAGAAESGELPESITKSAFRLAVRAHYAKKHALVDATVEGDPVRGLCGIWFVPTAIPDGLDVCPVCAGAYEKMRDGVEPTAN